MCNKYTEAGRIVVSCYLKIRLLKFERLLSTSTIFAPSPLILFTTWFAYVFRTTIELDILDKILVNLFIICKYVIAQMRQATQASGPFVQANQAEKSNRSVWESLLLR